MGRRPTYSRQVIGLDLRRARTSPFPLHERLLRQPYRPSQARSGESLHLSESAIEKYANAIFTKLGLSEERKISRRVGAVLVYLRDLDRRT